MFSRSMLTLCLISMGVLAHAQDHVFAAKETGLPGSDYVVSETAHTATTVSLSIPGFEKRSAAESRWMMCVYTNLALIYHHDYWTSVYPEAGNDTVLIGFPAAKTPESLQALGPEFLGPTALKTVAPVINMIVMCGKLGYKFQYAPGT